MANSKVAHNLTDILSRELIRHRFSLGKEIGKGGFGTVFLLTLSSENRIYAMKHLSVDNKNLDENKKKEMQEKMRDEAIRSIRLKGIHLVQCYSVVHFKENSSYGIIMDKARHGDLNLFINKYHSDLFNASYVFNKDKLLYHKHNDYLLTFFVSQVIDALLCLQKYNLAHLDIKPENILLNDLFQVKLCDYGQTKDFSKAQVELKHGTPSYMAPEFYKAKRQIDGCNLDKIDTFALGVTIFKFLFNVVVISKKEQITLTEYNKCLKEADKKIKETNWITDDLKDFLKQLLCLKIKERLSLKAAACHKWLNNKTKRKEIKHITEINENEQMKFFVQMHSINDLKLKHKHKKDRQVNIYNRPSLFHAL